MKKILLTLSLVICATFVFAQREDNLKINNARLTREGNSAVLTFTVQTNNCVKRREIMTLSPRLVFGTSNLKADQFAIAGRTKMNMLKREEKLTGKKSAIPRYGVKKEISYTFTAPYSADMYSANLKIDRKIEDCCRERELSTLNIPLNVDESMKQQVKFDTPVKTKPVSVAKEKNIDVQLDDAVLFKVGKSNINMNIESNINSIDKAVASIKEIMNTKDANITSISVTGYASPEGSDALNDRLSKERATTYMNILIERTGLNASLFTALAGGENWDLLRQLIEKSTLKTKAELMKVIDETSNQDERQNKLKSMPAYNYIYTNFYPVLRKAGMVKVKYSVTE